MIVVETVYVDPHPNGGWVISTSDESRGGWDMRYKRDAVSDAKKYARGWVQDEGVEVGVEVDGDSVAYYIPIPAGRRRRRRRR